MVMMRPTTHEGYELLHEGVIALSRVEANGMKVDVDYLNRAIVSCEEKRKRIRAKLQETKVWGIWRKRFGERANLTSDAQLASVLFEEMRIEPKEFTEKGRPSTDEGALEKLDLKFVKGYVLMKKYEKASGTYLKGIQRELMNGFIHPVFNLHTTQTYRSSSDTPNFQNMPVRNPMMAELIRNCFISRFGKRGVIVENDYKGLEVSISACYHLDPKFIRYITDPAMDMHRDMAMQCFMLTPEDMKAKSGKNLRYGAKNMFVFPQFYGDFYPRCAQSLWDWVERAQLTTAAGVPIREHLRAKGITRLGKCDPSEKPMPGTFEHHIKQVEDDFWNNRFGVYGKWKKTWWNEYLENGGFDTHTGFRIEGVMDRNQVINYPVQGSAFHCLLWSLIRIQKILRKEKMRSVIAGQIHDSLIGDVHADELTDYLAIVKQVSEHDVRKHWDWISVPLTVENEIVPLGESWFHKREVEFKDGIYTFKEGDNKLIFPDSQQFLSALKRKAA